MGKVVKLETGATGPSAGSSESTTICSQWITIRCLPAYAIETAIMLRATGGWVTARITDRPCDDITRCVRVSRKAHGTGGARPLSPRSAQVEAGSSGRTRGATPGPTVATGWPTVTARKRGSLRNAATARRTPDR